MPPEARRAQRKADPMYQFSRGIYRELAPMVEPPATAGASTFETSSTLLRACEGAVERLAPTATISRGRRGRCSATSAATSRSAARSRSTRSSSATWRSPTSSSPMLPRNGVDAKGNPLQCRAVTRKGTACQRTPLAHNGYCPSHQHLAETEDAHRPRSPPRSSALAPTRRGVGCRGWRQRRASASSGSGSWATRMAAFATARRASR